MPTKSPGLMSSNDALATPATFQPGFSISSAFGPSRVFTVSVEPSRPTIVPRTRTFSAACAGDEGGDSEERRDGDRAAEGLGQFQIHLSTLHSGLSKSLVATPRNRPDLGPRALIENSRSAPFIRQRRRFPILRSPIRRGAIERTPHLAGRWDCARSQAREQRSRHLAVRPCSPTASVARKLPVGRPAGADHLRVAVANDRHFGDPRHR